MATTSFSRPTWYEFVNVAIAAAIAGDDDTTRAVLDARNQKLDPIRNALLAAVDAILDGTSEAPEATAPHRDSPFHEAAPNPFIVILGGRTTNRDDFEN